MHEALSPWLLGFGWAMLLVAHYWNRTRHQGGGLPWVLSVLWLSTWVMVVNSAIFVIEEALVGHQAEALGMNWPHVILRGASAIFLVLLALDVARAVGLSRIDLARKVGLLLGAQRWRTYAVGHMVNMVAGLTLVMLITAVVKGVG